MNLLVNLDLTINMNLDYRMGSLCHRATAVIVGSISAKLDIL